MALALNMKDLSGSASSLRTDETPAGVGHDGRTQTNAKINSNGLRNRGRGFFFSTFSFLLASLVVAIMVSSLVQPLYANPTCILNCAQCVKIYGEFFDGHSCAKVCMESREKFESFVDCADPTTIAKFLKNY